MEDQNIPQSVLKYGFNFDWNEEDVWKLDYPTEEMDLAMLEWHFTIPFWNWNNTWYNLTPNQVIENKDKYKEQYERILNANIDYPIDIMENKGRYVILDGLHRLAKYKILGYTKIKVRIIPRTEIKNIAK